MKYYLLKYLYISRINKFIFLLITILFIFIIFIINSALLYMVSNYIYNGSNFIIVVIFVSITFSIMMLLLSKLMADIVMWFGKFIRNDKMADNHLKFIDVLIEYLES